MKNFEILDLLGEGATATVHRARCTDRAGQIVALKRARPGNRVAAAALRVEAEMLRSVDHPNVLRVVDVIDRGGTVSLALQLAPGGSLAGALAARTWSEADALTAARELAAAIAECHRVGVVHGDVATTNVLLAADGSALLADFGNRQVSAGTPGFVAPEVAAGGATTPESDVFGLGKVFETLGAAAGTERLAGVAAAATCSDPPRRPTAQEVVQMLASPVPVAAPPAQAPPLRTRPFTRVIAAPAEEIAAPPPGPRRRPAVSRSAKVAVALGAVMIATGSVQLAARGEPAHAGARCLPTMGPLVPAGAEVIEADADGDGCPNVIIRRGAVITIGSDRFVMGHPGDGLHVADWDCDGDATPAVFRPASRRLAVFDEWPKPGERVAAPRVAVVARTPAAPTC